MKEIIYEASSQTIRQLPENYMIADRIQGRWRCDPEPAADWKVVRKIFKLLFFSHKLRYGPGESLVNKYNRS